MTNQRWVCITCAVALIWMPACARAEKPLPRSFEPLPVVFQEPVDFAAVCVAEDEPQLGVVEGSARSVTQRFRLVGLVVGRGGGRSRARMDYAMSSDGFERAVRKGERVVWLARYTEGGWRGVHVFEDSPANRELAYSRFARGFYSHMPEGLEVRVETSGVCFARGQPIPVHVQIDNTNESPIELWSTFSALQFEVLAEDGELVRCKPVHMQRFDRTAPLIVKQYDGPVETADLADLCDWLPKGGQRSYTLLWRGKVRLGDRKANPVEVVSESLRLTVRDASTLAWGAEADGAACGLAAENADVSMGDRVMFHFGVKADSERVDPHLYIYRFCTEDEVTFTFRNTETGTNYRRFRDWFPGGPPYSPKAEDFFRLRAQPAFLWADPVRLLDETGEQIPAGTYEVTATYESRVAERSSLPPNRGPWKLLRGPLVSSPAIVRVRYADPESVAVYTNSAIELQGDDELCSWTGSQGKPTVLRVARRPGFGFHTWAVTSVAVGASEFQWVGEGGYGGGLILRDSFVGSTWEPGFPHGLGPEACRALAAREPVQVRVEVTMYETADIYRPFSPTRGDSRLIWQGRLEARRP
jgi:hypothetical protein